MLIPYLRISQTYLDNMKVASMNAWKPFVSAHSTAFSIATLS